MNTAAMTIDVEDYYHVHAFKDSIQRSEWSGMESRVEANTHRMLDLFAATETKATFFTLGVVAADRPEIVKRIVSDGHELASHGWDHWAVFEQDRATFLADVRRAKHTLEDIAGAEVKGYRAASFSIDGRSPWAYDILADTGHLYSSSSHPIAHDAYGDPDADRGPHKTSSGIVEIPVITATIGKRRVPVGGGGFFRLLPLAWFTRAHRQAVNEGLTPNFYLHPWEIDPGQPRIKDAPLKSRFRHYVGLSKCERKLKRLLHSATWTRMDEAYHGWLGGIKRSDDGIGNGFASDAGGSRRVG